MVVVTVLIDVDGILALLNESNNLAIFNPELRVFDLYS